MRAALRVSGAFGALAVLLAACSTSVDGAGTAGTASGSRAAVTSSPDFPSGSSRGGSPAGSSVPPSVASSTPTYQVETVRGTSSGRSIAVRVYAHDRIIDCAAHAYGTTMIRFLRAHPCRGATRVLGTTQVDGHTVVLSIVSTGFTGTAGDPYGPAARFIKLEQADGTGSIDDLLRAGHPIPGLATRIPEHEVFEVLGQDTGVVVFDAWYASGSTDEGDPALKRLATDLFLTSLTAN